MDTRRRTARAAVCAAALAAALGGCTGKTQGPDGYTPDYAAFADEVGPVVYVPKVKTILTGLPATDAEIQRIVANPDALPALIDDWMNQEPTRPLFEERMLAFFRTAFQQRLSNIDLITDSLDTEPMDVTYLGTIEATLRYSFEDSFPLTVWQLVRENRPFTEALTTRRYMMTTALMAAMAYTDMYAGGDEGQARDRIRDQTNLLVVFDPLAVGKTGAPLTLEEAVAAFDANGVGTWTWPLFVPDMTTSCRQALQASRSYEVEEYSPSEAIFRTIFGHQSYPNPNGACRQWGSDPNLAKPRFRPSDLSDWRWVTIEQLPIYEDKAFPSPLFWDLPGLRAATTLRLNSPHVGFMGTPAWFGNWPTNQSNQARVTANQALIVAIGKSVLPSTAVAPAPSSATDTAHAANAACAACHMYLDPLREFFRQSYTFNYHEQRNYSVVAAPARYMLDGMDEGGTGVADLARILANHPRFALGWAQKLVFWATNTIADESDPDLQHVARIFAASNYDFRALVRAVFSSPLVTLSRGTKTTRAQGTINVGIARRDQLCASLSARLGIHDVCEQRYDARGLDLRGLTQMIADDGYYRAAELPSMPRNPDLFFRASAEVICETIAGVIVDNNSSDNGRYSSGTPQTRADAIEDMVTRIMGLPYGDGRHGRAVQLLNAHYKSATSPPYSASRTDGLRSVFVFACTSPSALLLGL